MKWEENEEEGIVSTYLLFIAGLYIKIAKFFMIIILIEKIFQCILLLMLTELKHKINKDNVNTQKKQWYEVVF